MTQVTRDRVYRRHRFPAEVITHAVWLYLRFPPSLRMVEDLLAARGITRFPPDRASLGGEIRSALCRRHP